MDFSKDCEGFINHNMCVSAMYCKKDFWDHSDALRHMEMAHNTTGVSIPNPNPLWQERQEHYCPFCDPVIMFNSLHCVLLLNCCRKKISSNIVYMSAVGPGSWRHIHTTENTAQYPFSWPGCHPTAAQYTPHSPDNVSIRMVQKIHLNTLIMKYMGGGDNQTGFLD